MAASLTPPLYNCIRTTFREPAPYERGPATVVIMPDGSTLRTRPLLLSAMYIFPDASTATQTGLLSCACLAGPPSPPQPAVPFPATVVMFPPGANFLTVLLSGSAIYIFPAASDASP